MKPPQEEIGKKEKADVWVWEKRVEGKGDECCGWERF
jgi:hypothetical protein